MFPPLIADRRSLALRWVHAAGVGRYHETSNGYVNPAALREKLVFQMRRW